MSTSKKISKRLGLTAFLFAALPLSTALAAQDAAPPPTSPPAPPPPEATTATPAPPPPSSSVPAAPAPEAAPPPPPETAAKPSAPEAPRPAPEAKDEHKKDEHKDKEKEKHWYEKLSLKGYTQLRYNRLLESNEKYVTPGDKSIGKDGGFSLRRARLVVSGDVHPHVSVYLQTEFASGIGDITAVATIRDWYADLYLDKKKEFRFRMGESKIPFGFENPQSSSNRAPLDRADALNSGVPGERDLGIIFYWTPAKAQKLFKHLVDDGLKGSGNYGVAALGIYNGQTINTKEIGKQPHAVARLAYPFQIGGQILELGAGGYTGKYTIKKDEDVMGTSSDNAYNDARVYGQIVLYPQPIGFQAEFNYGTGPQFKDGSIRNVPLHGGYAMLIAHAWKFYPFVRAQYYQGAYKTDTNVPEYKMKEIEFGTEFAPIKNFEATVSYMIGQRPNLKEPEATRMQDGRLLRIQLQANY